MSLYWQLQYTICHYYDYKSSPAPALLLLPVLMLWYPLHNKDSHIGNSSHTATAVEEKTLKPCDQRWVWIYTLCISAVTTSWPGHLASQDGFICELLLSSHLPAIDSQNKLGMHYYYGKDSTCAIGWLDYHKTCAISNPCI